MTIQLPIPGPAHQIDVASVLGAAAFGKHERSRQLAKRVAEGVPLLDQIADSWVRFDSWADELMALQNLARERVEELRKSGDPAALAAAEREAELAERAYDAAMDDHEAFCNAVLGIEVPDVSCAVAKARLYFAIYGAEDASGVPDNDARQMLETLITDLEGLATPPSGHEFDDLLASRAEEAPDEQTSTQLVQPTSSGFQAVLLEHACAFSALAVATTSKSGKVSKAVEKKYDDATDRLCCTPARDPAHVAYKLTAAYDLIETGDGSRITKELALSIARDDNREVVERLIASAWLDLMAEDNRTRKNCGGTVDGDHPVSTDAPPAAAIASATAIRIASLEALAPAPASNVKSDGFDGVAWVKAYEEAGGVICKSHTEWAGEPTHEALVFSEPMGPSDYPLAFGPELNGPEKLWAVYLAAPSMPGTSTVSQVRAALEAVGREVCLISHPMAAQRAIKHAAE